MAATTQLSHLVQKYLDKHPTNHPIKQPPRKQTGMIVVIPAYRENQLLFQTLDTLKKCEAPTSPVEVIVVLNASENDGREVIDDQEECRKNLDHYIRKDLPAWLTIHYQVAYNLRKKHFGAGLARKTGLDEAVKRFHQLNKPDGTLICLDADSPVASNYFRAIEKWYQNPDNKGAMVYFEHPLSGEAYPDEVYEAILLYELHLRYYLQALSLTGFPYAYHTVGSCMTFRAYTYAQAGGMPKKQAGEDFYFLQKLIPLGGFGNITDTVVYPSPRPSNRVIFGTGASIKNHIEGRQLQGTTYHPQAFDDLTTFFGLAPSLRTIEPEKFEEWTYQLNGPLRSFLLNSDFEKEIKTIQENCSNDQSFIKRFFGAFNAFKVVKYLNYAHEHFYSKPELFEAALSTLEKKNIEVSDILDEEELLDRYRQLEKNEGA